jgi:hypothetical protein
VQADRGRAPIDEHEPLGHRGSRVLHRVARRVHREGNLPEGYLRETENGLWWGSERALLAALPHHRNRVLPTPRAQAMVEGQSEGGRRMNPAVVFTGVLFVGIAYTVCGMVYALAGSITKFLGIKGRPVSIWTIVGLTLIWPIIFTEEEKMDEPSPEYYLRRPEHLKW